MNIESFFSLTYGLYIVSAGDQGKYNGYVSNTVFQVTAEPPQVAISCSKNNLTTEMIARSGKFSVSVLHQSASPDLIGLFGYKSGKDVNKFENVNFVTGRSGTPIIVKDTIAWFDCEVTMQTDTGTHILFIGQVIDAEILDTSIPPLTYAYYRAIKKGLSPKNAPTYIDPAKLENKPAKAVGKKYRCLACSFIYDPAEGDPESGIAPGTQFEDLPDDWQCPICGATKDMFEEIL
ncbi:MAG TPA: rubredoxin [Bacteroidales bacterium]|nr:rubredoxin [Bacteroidales bacterium]